MKYALRALLLLASLISGYSVAADSVFREIVAIRIKHQGENDPSVSSIPSCKKFTLTTTQVKQFLTRAKEVDSRTYTQDLDFGVCFVAGTLTLRNGLTGEWQIRDTRTARISYSDQHVMLLHCPRCAGTFGE